MSETKKYYWLKLQRDFFKRHDIQIIESMPNGDKYLIFYLKLLCESVDHDGNLRFSESIPYEESMLATITHMDIDIVKSAVKLFTNLKMMDIMDDGTYYMNQIERMVGSTTSDAIRMKTAREKKNKSIPHKDEVNNVQKCSENVHQSIEYRDKSIEIDSEEKKPDKPVKTTRVKKEFITPTLEQVESYVLEKQLVINPNKFIDWYSKTDWKDNEGKQIKNWKMKAINWDSREKEKNPSAIPYSKPLPLQDQVPREKKKCPKCGGDIRGSACVVCYTNYDYNGDEI